MTGRHVELVETLLRQRSAGLRRTRFGAGAAGLQDPLQVTPQALPPVDEQLAAANCTNCGGSIPAGRLKALPDAVRCVGCQLEFEAQRP
ncbi:MAG: TraR/DksA C4-type zinc finger protein [Thermoleophilaceae bacterium]